MNILVVDVECENHVGLGPGSDPQVSFNITVNLTNVGQTSYKLEPSDWVFHTDKGLPAEIWGWALLPRAAGNDNYPKFEPGESHSMQFHASQGSSMWGNLTEVQFRDEPVRPLAPHQPCTMAA